MQKALNKLITLIDKKSTFSFEEINEKENDCVKKLMCNAQKRTIKLYKYLYPLYLV